MNKDDLRKVTYQQVKSMGFDPRSEQRKENEKLEEKRDGFFHKWVDGETLALIEDCETGECLTISYENIQFKDN